MESIKFEWKVENQDTWFENYGKLKEYFKKNGHTIVPQKSGGLGLWVTRQRQFFKKNKLTQEKIDLLNQINFQWRIRN